MIYRRKSELEVAEIRPELDIVRDAARELQSSARLKQVLKVRVLRDYEARAC